MAVNVMTSFLAALNLSTTLVFITVLLHLFSPTSSLLNHKKPPPSSNIQGSLVEEKTRLGSTPPSCYNKCNNCHPCMAVQVPTMPSRSQLRPEAEAAAAALSGGAGSTTTIDNYFDSSPYSSGGGGNNRYSNYKPLGWKCRCGGHFFNP